MPRRLMIPIERRLIALRGVALFDPDFYRLQNPDVGRALAADEEPFDHYLRHGWREGRAPNARFDDGYYRAEAGLARTTTVSPLAHFIAFGQVSGLCPVPGIDLSMLERTNPALSVARMDPYQSLVTGTVGADPQTEDRPDLADLEHALRGFKPSQARQPRIDVIVPIYEGRAETLNTLWHLFTATTELPYEIICIDDATPDPSLAADLDQFANRGWVTLRRNPENRGFCASVNRGMGLHPGRDVVWLNADTEVYDGWIDRLHAAAYSAPNVATVTPLTNNGTICSYPRMNVDNPGRLEVAWNEIDRMAADVNSGVRLPTPTAVGFATYVRRAALDRLGGLDEDAFGRGYGEENDFSQRACAAGWQNLIAADVFIRHFGATSFQGARADRIERALKILDRRYPEYRHDVQAHISSDPAAPARHALDLARLKALGADRNILIVTHSLGGGTQQHVHEEIQRLTGQGFSVFLLSGGADGSGTARLSHPGAAALPSLQNLPLAGPVLWEVIASLNLSEVHIHHLIDFPGDAAALFQERLARLALPVTFVVHDYFAICPRVNLIDAKGFYCGEPGLSGCLRCIARRGSRAGRPDLVAWRAGYAQLLRQAHTIRVPDQDVADRLRRYFSQLPRIVVKPHEPDVVIPRHRTRRRPGPRRIAVLGAIGATKGFDIVLSLGRHIQRNALPMTLTVIGYTQNDVAAAAAGVTVTGAYVNRDVDRLIRQVDPDVIWIPSLWPETYSYTLSLALASGRTVAAFDIGALGSRLRAARRGRLLPLTLAHRTAPLFDALMAEQSPFDLDELPPKTDRLGRTSPEGAQKGGARTGSIAEQTF